MNNVIKHQAGRCPEAWGAPSEPNINSAALSLSAF